MTTEHLDSHCVSPACQFLAVMNSNLKSAKNNTDSGPGSKFFFSPPLLP